MQCYLKVYVQRSRELSATVVPAFVALPCCLRKPGPQPVHMVSDTYVAALRDVAGVVPILIPAIGTPPFSLLDRVDGLLLTGSPSNIEPHHYDGPPPPANNMSDPARDGTILPLIRAAIARNMPVLGICRGLQELNVAMGGSLHQEVHRVAGRLDHREPRGVIYETRYSPVHPVALSAEGRFTKFVGGTREIMVNSLHGQGVDRLAPDLDIEAEAPDGQIEAVRHKNARFVMAVQWHPEWNAGGDQFSKALFAKFGDECRRFAVERAPAIKTATYLEERT